MVLYMDDCCVFAHDSSVIQEVISDLDQDFVLKDEGDIEDFLGIHVSKSVGPNNSTKIEMTQSGLINSILQDVGLHDNDPKTKRTPAAEILHPTGSSDLPFDAHWSYRSVIGKLNFLAQNTRPDIAFAVHQCARYCSNPRKLHQIAVKHLCRYLLATRSNGLIFEPSGTNTLDAYCDSDFAGTWSTKTANQRTSSLSRTGFVITYGGCPVHWASKLQTEIALSTCEAEFIALSQCARSLIPMRTIMNELTKHFRVPLLSSPLCEGTSRTLTRLHRSVIHEDNAGCLELAMDTTHKYRPRTKHIRIKYWHFRNQIASGHIVVEKIHTSLNWADIFTKALGPAQFESIRKLMMGW